MSAQQPMALEYHGKAQTEGHWRKGQHLIDALAYIDPLTPDVKQQVDKLVEDEMRRSTKRPADYLKELPPMPPVKFEGHPMLLQEYDRVRASHPMPPLDVTRYSLNPPPQSKRNDYQAWLSASDNAHAQLEHQLNRITNLELMLKYGPNAWRAQTQLDESLVKQLEATLMGLRKQIDSLNRERKLQQSTTGTELRVLEDKYYAALRKNLEISAACQAVEEEMELLEFRIMKHQERQQRQQQQEAGGEQQQQQQQGPDGGGGGGGGGAAGEEGGTTGGQGGEAGRAAAANGAATAEPQPQQLVEQQQQQEAAQLQLQEEQQPPAGGGAAAMEQ